jgi:hypothetical protein
MKNWKLLLIAGMVLLAIGFFAGRQTSDVKIKTVAVKGKTVTDTIYSQQLSPDHSEIPDNPNYPVKHDTVRVKIKGDSIVKFIFSKVDTAKIIQNYITKNSYQKLLFDNDNGKLVVGAEVQYNLLQKLDCSFTPIHKETTIEKKRVLTPFVLGSYNSGYFGAGVGIYYYDVGVSVKYLNNFKTTGYEIGGYYKF